MSIQDLAEMIGKAFTALITVGSILWIFHDFKLRKIYDELKEIRKDIERKDIERKDIKRKENGDERNRDCF